MTLALNFCCQGQHFFDGLEEKDDSGLARIISMLLDSIEMKSEDVANWPNVRFCQFRCGQ